MALKESRQKGGKVMWGVRPPKELEEYVDLQMRRRKVNRSVILLEMLHAAMASRPIRRRPVDFR